MYGWMDGLVDCGMRLSYYRSKSRLSLHVLFNLRSVSCSWLSWIILPGCGLNHSSQSGIRGQKDKYIFRACYYLSHPYLTLNADHFTDNNSF